LAESLSTENDGTCIISKTNTLEEDVTIDPPVVNLEETEDECEKTVMTFTAHLVRDNNRLSRLRNEHRYNDIHHCSQTRHTYSKNKPKLGYKHKNIQIPEIHKEEVLSQTEQKLQDEIIALSNSPWNSQILVIPKKANKGVRMTGIQNKIIISQKAFYPHLCVIPLQRETIKVFFSV
jgi:hydroxymethylpyrimidine pyrophosphatase-like HAD family hydrolase